MDSCEGAPNTKGGYDSTGKKRVNKKHTPKLNSTWIDHVLCDAKQFILLQHSVGRKHGLTATHGDSSEHIESFGSTVS